LHHIPYHQASYLLPGFLGYQNAEQWRAQLKNVYVPKLIVPKGEQEEEEAKKSRTFEEWLRAEISEKAQKYLSKIEYPTRQVLMNQPTLEQLLNNEA